jgi:DNA modification methylase
MEIKEGDIWILGKNRLMCGNSLKTTDIDKLLDGQKADMLFTDPPYNVNYSPESRGRCRTKPNLRIMGGIMGDKDTPDAFNAIKFLELLNTGIVKGACYICCGTNQIQEYYPWVHKHMEYRPTFIMWIKNGFSMLGRDYHSQYEPILYFYFDEKKWRGDRAQTDIWFIKRRNTAKYFHPTQKPVALAQKAILNSSDINDIILDLFGGSGTTLIACENTDRRCYMMELDPKYIKIIIDRWEAFTKKEAVKI